MSSQIKSDEIDAVAKALHAAQGTLRAAAKSATNPHFKSKYAPLSEIWAVAVDAMKENGLSIAQYGIGGDAATLELMTILMHDSGQYIGGALVVPLAKHDPQGVGSAITYARRYAIACMLGIITEEDDDGNAARADVASEKPQATAPRAPTPPPAKRESLPSLPAAECPRCGGAMWDNRVNKKNPKAPDYKCKDATCIDERGYVSSFFPGEWEAICEDRMNHMGDDTMEEEDPF